MLDQIKRYWIYMAAAVIAVVMIGLSIFKEEWTVDAQLELAGKIVALLTTLLALKFSNPNSVAVVPTDSLGVVQDELPTPEEKFIGTDDEGEIVEGLPGRHFA